MKLIILLLFLLAFVGGCYSLDFQGTDLNYCWKTYKEKCDTFRCDKAYHVCFNDIKAILGSMCTKNN
jgi:hypothetical protein